MLMRAMRFYFERHTKLNGAAYLARTKATGAYVNGLGSAVYNSLNSTNVGLPSSVCSTVRVRYGLTENNALSANFAFCHA